MKKYFALTAVCCLTLLFLQLVPQLVFTSVPTVQISYPESSNIISTITVKGQIEEGEKETITVSGGGLIGTVYAEEGDYVRKGMVIATYYPAISATGTPADDEMSSVLSQYGIETPASSMEYATTAEKIRAPFSGTLTSLSFQEGESVSGKISVTVSDLTELKINCSVGENNISRVSLGQKAVITGKAFQDRSYRGTVVEIAPVAQQSIANGLGEITVSVIIEISASDAFLKPGYSAEAKITIDQTEDALLVPYEIIRQDEENQEFFYVYQDGVAVKRVVETGAELDDSVEIKNGITQSDIIIVSSNKELIEYQKVFLQKDDQET